MSHSSRKIQYRGCFVIFGEVKSSKIICGFCPAGSNPTAIFQPWMSLLPDDVCLMGYCRPGRSFRPGECAEHFEDVITEIIAGLLDFFAEYPEEEEEEEKEKEQQAEGQEKEKTTSDGSLTSEERTTTKDDQIVGDERTTRKKKSKRKLILYGHSLGTLEAMHVAQQLEATEEWQEIIPAPHYLICAGKSAPCSMEHCLPASQDSEAAMVERLRRLGGLADELMTADFLQFFVPLFRADLRLHEDYYAPSKEAYRRAAHLRSTPILYLGGSADSIGPPAAQEAWSACTDAAFSLRWFPGGHFFMNSHQHEFIQLILSCFDS